MLFKLIGSKNISRLIVICFFFKNSLVFFNLMAFCNFNSSITHEILSVRIPPPKKKKWGAKNFPHFFL